MKTTIAALCALLSLLLSACARPDEAVSKAIGTVVRDKGVHEFRLASVTNFDWDKVYLFDPYTPRDHICKVLGIQPKYCEREVPYQSVDDGTMTLAFVSGTRLVRYSKHSRWNGDFAPCPKAPIPSAKAVFRVSPSGSAQNGDPWLKLLLHEA